MTRARGAALALLAGGAAAGLSACGSGHAPGAAAPGPGARLYAANCAACHRPDGSGIDGVQPPLAGTPVTLGDPGELLGWVLFGRRPRALPPGGYAGLMPQFSYLSDADLALLLTHVRTSFGNHAGPISAAMVASARAAERAR